jgi:hypothetical protein
MTSKEEEDKESLIKRSNGEQRQRPDKFRPEVRFAQWAEYCTMSCEFADKSDEDGNDLDASFRMKQTLDASSLRIINFYNSKPGLSESYNRKVREFLEELKNIEVLGFYKCTSIMPVMLDHRFADKVTSVTFRETKISRENVSSLTRLELSKLEIFQGCEYDDSILCDMFDVESVVAKSVKELKITVNRHVKLCLPENLASLDLESSGLSHEQIDEILNELLRKDDPLDKLNFSRNMFNQNNTEKLGELLRKRKPRTLVLEGCALTNITLLILLEVIKDSVIIENVNVSGNDFTDDFATEGVLSTLKTHSSLKTFVYDHQHEQIRRLLDALHVPSTKMMVTLISAFHSRVGTKATLAVLSTSLVRMICEQLYGSVV